MVRHFDRLIIEGLGLDRHPELRDDYFGNYTRLIYLAQIEDPGLKVKARGRRRPAGPCLRLSADGYGELEGFIDAP